MSALPPVAVVSAEPPPYAECSDCQVVLADRAALTAHQKETMAPTGEAGVVARSHSVRVVNPTPEERRVSLIRGTINDALDRLYERLDERVQDGDFTEAELVEQLAWFGLDDGWTDYVAEGAS